MAEAKWNWEGGELFLERWSQAAQERLEAGARLIEGERQLRREESLKGWAALGRAIGNWQEGDEPQLWSSLAGQWSEYRQWVVGELERSFRREFKGLAAQKGWRVSVIGQEPLELQLGPFTLRPQWREGLADLYYARLPLRSQLPLVSERILEVAASESQLLNGGELPEELFQSQFFAALWQSYRLALYNGRQSLGARVPLRQIWPLMALARQGSEFQKAQGGEFREYTRLQLAWDIARLRQGGGLARGGWRLYLGTATIGATKNKDQVFWLEDGVGRGQYYLSLWFQRQERD